MCVPHPAYLEVVDGDAHHLRHCSSHQQARHPHHARQPVEQPQTANANSGHRRRRRALTAGSAVPVMRVAASAVGASPSADLKFEMQATPPPDTNLDRDGCLPASANHQPPRSSHSPSDRRVSAPDSLRDVGSSQDQMFQLDQAPESGRNDTSYFGLSQNAWHDPTQPGRPPEQNCLIAPGALKRMLGDDFSEMPVSE